MSSSLVANGTNTRGRVVLPDIAPFNDLYSFTFLIKLRGLRVSHPTPQRLMVTPNLNLSIQGGSLVFTSSTGGDCSLPLFGATEGEVALLRTIRPDGSAFFTLLFTRRTGEVLGEVSADAAISGALSISGGAGLTIAADNLTNSENLQAKIDDFRFVREGSRIIAGDPFHTSPNRPWPDAYHYLRYGFVGNGNDASPNLQHLTMENALYETTPETLAVLAEASRLILSGFTPDPGFSIKVFERTQFGNYNYARPLYRELSDFHNGLGLVSLPIPLVGRNNQTRFFYVVRVLNNTTGVLSPDSNEVFSRAPLPPAAPGAQLITVDEGLEGIDSSALVSQAINGDRYKVQGVLLSAAPYGPFVGAWSFNDSPWGALYASTRTLAQDPVPRADGVVTIDFVVPGTTQPGRTGFVQFNVCMTEPGQSPTWQAVAYNNSGIVLETISGAADTQVTFSRAQGDISRVVFTPSILVLTLSGFAGIDSGYEAIDTLRFNDPVAA